MKFFKHEDHGNGCHVYTKIEDIASHLGEFFTQDEVVDACAENGIECSATSLSNYDTHVYVSGEWDKIHVNNLVQKYKKKIGKKFPTKLVLERYLNNNWTIPHHMMQEVVVELFKLFPKKYKLIDRTLHLMEKRPLSEFEAIRIVNWVVTTALDKEVSTHLTIRSTDTSIGGIQNSIRAKIACGTNLAMFMKYVDHELQNSYRPEHPLYQEHRKQVINTFKQLLKDKKPVPINKKSS
jgi:hypothetical protein